MFAIKQDHVKVRSMMFCAWMYNRFEKMFSKLFAFGYILSAVEILAQCQIPATPTPVPISLVLDSPCLGSGPSKRSYKG